MEKKYTAKTDDNGWSVIVGPDGYEEGPYRYAWEAEEFAEKLNAGTLAPERPSPTCQAWCDGPAVATLQYPTSGPFCTLRVCSACGKRWQKTYGATTAGQGLSIKPLYAADTRRKP